MNNPIVANIIKNLAKKQGVAEAEVITEMETAIKLCFEASDGREKRDNIFGKNNVPDVEEFLIKLTMVLVS